jgi:CBS domain-containing protein
MRVRDIMSAPVLTVTPDQSIESAAAAMLESKVASLVVVDAADSTSPVGIITQSDFDLRGEGGVGYSWFTVPTVLGETVWTEPDFHAAYERARHRPVGSIMSAPCVTADADDEVYEAARRMVRHGIRHLPILSDGRLVGIVTALDFLALLAREQETA